MPLKRTTFFFTLIDVLPERRTFFPREERSLREKNVLYSTNIWLTLLYILYLKNNLQCINFLIPEDDHLFFYGTIHMFNPGKLGCVYMRDVCLQYTYDYFLSRL